MLNSETLTFLASKPGCVLLKEAREIPGDFLTRVTRLRRTYSPENAAAALELLDLRSRAKSRFSRAEEMFFTPQGLEQASGEAIAQWRAEQFSAGAEVLDLCCGMGGDAAALAGRSPVYAFDRDPAAALCTRLNGEVLGVGANLHAASADVTKIRWKADAAFFDPSRRKDGRRVRSGEEYSPPLSFIDEVLAHVPNAAVKVSPALPDETLDDLVHRLGGRVEFVSDRGECKEALVWFGEIGPDSPRSATLLPTGASLVEDESDPLPEISEPLAWLYEPDPAVIRAHLVPGVAAILRGRQMDAGIAYLTAEKRIETPFATAYKVVEWMPFNLKRLQARLKSLGRRVTAIKKRAVPLDVASLNQTLTGGGDHPAVVVLTRINGKTSAVICEPPEVGGPRRTASPGRQPVHQHARRKLR